MIKKAAVTAALFFTLTCAVSAEEPPPHVTPIQILQEGYQEQAVLTDLQTVEGERTKIMIKIYEAPPEFDPAFLNEGPFQKQGYQYDTGTVLRMSENYQTDSRLASRTVTVSHAGKEGSTTQFAPFLDYDDGEYQGQLILDRESIYTEAAGRTSYSYQVRDVREFPSLTRNDTYAIPKTAQKNGVALTLADVSWTNLGDSYTAAALYTGTGYGSKVTGYTSTAIYMGTVERDVLKSVTYKVIYEGTPILPPSANSLLFWISGGVLLLVLILGGILWRLRPNAKLHAMTPEGRYKVIRRYRMNYTDPLVDLGSPFVRQYQDFLVTVDSAAARKLSGAMIRVLLGGSDYVRQLLQWNGPVCGAQFHVDWPEAQE